LTANFDSKALQSVDDESPKVNSIQILKRDSDMFNNWQDKHFNAASNGHGVLYFSHHYAVFTKYFNESQALTSFWHLVAKTTSSAGQEFVSAIQAKQYPFFGSQFHPEKSPFEWRVDANRTKESIELVQLLSNNFVLKARLSPNRFTNSTNLIRQLIYNYNTVPPASVYSLQSFQEIYLFTEAF
jgi:gamma-glutamyl hydrolase